MSFDDVKRYIIEGMHPSIKQTIIHKDNPDLTALRKNALLIEKGIKESNPGGLPTESNTENLSELLCTLVNKIDQVNTGITENAQRISEI